MLPEVGHFLDDLRRRDEVFDRELATVLFTDIVGSTVHAGRLGGAGWKDLLSRHDSIVRDHLAAYQGVELDRTGDGFLAKFDGPARAAACAQAIVAAVQGLGIEVRAGLHTGELGRTSDVSGALAVVIAARVIALADASEVLATQTVRDLTLGSGLGFELIGEHTLKGIPDAWRIFRLRQT